MTLAINKIPLATNQACCNLIIDDNIADYRFVYYAYLNFMLNNAKYENGPALRNNYVHGSYSLNLKKHEGDYYDLDTIPQLFRFNVFLMLSNGLEAKVGTLVSPVFFYRYQPGVSV